MISKNYIDAAVKIREDFLETSTKLDKYELELKLISENIETYMKKLIDIKEGLKVTDSSKNIEIEIFNQIDLIQVESNKYSKLILPLIKKIEELQKREDALYHNIKEKYPKLNDDEIKHELSKWIKN